jgi:hypothetical protein
LCDPHHDGRAERDHHKRPDDHDDWGADHYLDYDDRSTNNHHNQPADNDLDR